MDWKIIEDPLAPAMFGTSIHQQLAVHLQKGGGTALTGDKAADLDQQKRGDPGFPPVAGQFLEECERLGNAWNLAEVVTE